MKWEFPLTGLERLLSAFVDAFIAVWEATEQDQGFSNPFKGRLSKIVYAGVDLKVYDSERYRRANGNLKRQLGIAANKKVVIDICRSVRGKGQLDFVESVSVVVKGYSEVVFLVVGEVN